MTDIITPNDCVLVKPTETGWKQIVAHVDAWNDDVRKRMPDLRHRMSVPRPDDDGFIKDQFWHVMRYFDWTAGAGSECPFLEMKKA